MYRDPLSQHLQNLDPYLPETAASKDRARAAQRAERVAALELTLPLGPDIFDRMLRSFMADDPDIHRYLTSQKAIARVAVLRYRAEHV